jgi:hypothetical protein
LRVTQVSKKIDPIAEKKEQAVASLVERITARIAFDKPTHLKPDTTYLVAKALRMWMAEPLREPSSARFAACKAAASTGV